MMHLRWAVPVILAVGGACASTPATSPPQDAGSEADSDPCAGLGCPVGLPSVTLAVQDTTGTPVPSPYFSEGGNQLLFQCDVFALDGGAGDAAGDAGPGKVCAKWKMYLRAGKHPITIDAQGFVSQTLDVDLKGPTGCCGQGEQLEKTVTLAKQ